MRGAASLSHGLPLRPPPSGQHCIDRQAFAYLTQATTTLDGALGEGTDP